MQKPWLRAWRIGRCVPTALLAIAEPLPIIERNLSNDLKITDLVF